MDIQKFFRQLWLWKSNHATGWLEAIGLTLLTLLICNYLNPLNPLFVKEIFPWPWLISLIIVFQYGFGPGLLTVFIIMLDALFQKNAGMLATVDFQNYILSGITLVMIVALFSSSWARQLMNAQTLLSYNDERLKSLSRSFYMLRTSTDYLEQNIITQPMTLRLAFQELQKLNVQDSALLSPDIAGAFLEILGQFCSLSTAAIYVAKDNRILDTPIVEVGASKGLLRQDPLIKAAMETGQICFINMDDLDDLDDYHYLIVAPLIDNSNQLIGLLTIEDMPFWNLTEETIRVLNILVEYYSKEIIINDQVREFLTEYPECSVEFAKQLSVLTSMKNKMHIDSALAAVLVSKELRNHHVIYNLQTKTRLLDCHFIMEVGDYDVIITLMPFTNAIGPNGYFTRVSQYLHNDMGLAVDNKNIIIRSVLLDKKRPSENMSYFLKFIEGKDLG